MWTFSANRCGSIPYFVGGNINHEEDDCVVCSLSCTTGPASQVTATTRLRCSSTAEISPTLAAHTYRTLHGRVQGIASIAVVSAPVRRFKRHDVELPLLKASRAAPATQGISRCTDMYVVRGHRSPLNRTSPSRHCCSYKCIDRAKSLPRAREEQNSSIVRNALGIVWVLEPRLAVSHARMLSPISESLQTINPPFETIPQLL